MMTLEDQRYAAFSDVKQGLEKNLTWKHSACLRKTDLGETNR